MSCRDPACRDPPAFGHHMGFISRGFPSPYGSCQREAKVRHQTAIKGSNPDFSLGLSSEVLSTIFKKDSGGLESVLPLLGELLKAIEAHLPACQLCRWQLGPSKWSLRTTKSLGPIIVTALRMGLPRANIGPATCGFACNCPVLEAGDNGSVRAQQNPPYK